MKDTWIPLHVVFGTGPIPVGAAKLITDAIKEMKTRGDLQSTAPAWQAIEYMAADYLSGFGRREET